jgi:hypothetical protein
VKARYVGILDAVGQVLVHRNVPSTPEAFLEIVAPLPGGSGGGGRVHVHVVLAWGRLRRRGDRVRAGPCLGDEAIHGGKAKNDKIDSHKIASLLRGGLLPQAYVYPATMRSTRDLIRRRLPLVRKRGQLLGHIQNTRAQYNLPVFGRKPA